MGHFHYPHLPAQGMGLHTRRRPSVLGGLGMFRLRSTLDPTADLISVIPVSTLESIEEIDLTSSEPPVDIVGLELFTVDGTDHLFVIVGSEVWDVTSMEFVGMVKGDLPPDVASALPPDTLESEEPQ